MRAARWAVIVAVLVAVVCLAWMAFLPAYAQHELHAITGFDVVITTALVPGRTAPTLVTAEAVQGMRPGSVVVDAVAFGQPAVACRGGDVTLQGLSLRAGETAAVSVIRGRLQIRQCDASARYGAGISVADGATIAATDVTVTGGQFGALECVTPAQGFPLALQTVDKLVDWEKLRAAGVI